MTSSMQRKLSSLLKTDYLGKVIHYQDELESTNTTLMELGDKGASEGTVVIADRQTAGRGRLGRSWISPPGSNLYISILFRPEIATTEASLFTLIASIALKELMLKIGIEEGAIKWPNDIQVNGKKVAGVLTEMRPRREVVDFIVVGIGVNINLSREDMNNLMGNVAHIATSMKENLGKDLDRSKFAADLLLVLEKWHKIYREKGKSQILREWTERWSDFNKRVSVEYDGEYYEGTAIGIDGHGYLLVQTDDGEINQVIAGDVIIL
jgi:BirA family biotin operon repressor/biotin-[acetyl-CoA-carboxylase] ligase